MPSDQRPAIFVSSTCYDLSQIRADIEKFIQGFGCDPMLSERSTFPVDPQAGTYENCCKNVRDRADILVLVVGNRYGSVGADGRSITNLEYEEARAKGVPIYAFVQKPVLAGLEWWKANPDGKCPGVDNPRLFEFVNSLVSGTRWVFGFETADDIIQILRNQLAFLFLDALRARQRLRDNPLPQGLRRLEGERLRLALEKPAGWEYLLFAECLREEIASYAELRRDHEFAIAIGSFEKVKPSETWEYLRKQLWEARQIIEVAPRVFGAAWKDALGLPGQPGDPEKVVHTARRFGDLYRAMLETLLRSHLVHVTEPFVRLHTLCGKLFNGAVKQIEDYSRSLPERLRVALHRIQSGESIDDMGPSLGLSLTLEDGWEEESSAEIERLGKELCLRADD